MQVQMIELTPDRARRFLSTMTKNRAVNEQRVTRMANDIREGRWIDNGATLVIGRSGQGLDGQHRCHAVIRSQKSIQVLLVTGVDDDAFPTIDNGKPKSGADMVKARGGMNWTAAAGCLPWVQAIRKGVMRTNIRLTNIDIDQLYGESMITVDEAVQIALRAKTILQPSPGSALFILFAERDRDAAIKFFEDLATGAGLLPGDPVLVLREALMRARMLSTHKHKVAAEQSVALVIRAWNHRRQNRAVTKNLKGLTEHADGRFERPAIL